MTRKEMLNRFIGNRDGVAAMEFAFIAPVMIFLFFAIVSGSDALLQSRRISVAVNTLADLSSQETTLSKAQVADLMSGVDQIIQAGGSSASIRLVSIVRDPNTNKAVVHWSIDNAGAEPYAENSPFSDQSVDTLLDASTSVIVAELDFTYSSALTQFLLPPIDFKRNATRWPRRSLKVQYCRTPNDCTT